MAAELRFAAMGTEAHVVVTGGPGGLAERARARVAEIEARWSRFRPDSELSRLNRRQGRVVVVSDDTFALVDRAVAAWRLTGGAYDPTVLPALRAAGYDRDFAALAGPTAGAGDGGRASATCAPGPAPGCGAIELLPRLRAVVLPPGVELDPGGIGKGLAADLVTAELLEAGARGALVNLGGDVRVRGEAPAGGMWPIAVADPLDPARDLLVLGLDDGAVATSSRLRRRWTLGSVERHHLLDPRTGEPVETRLVAVTVVAGEGWWAEAATKQAFLTGWAGGAPAGALLLTVTDTGETAMSAGLAAVAA